MAKSKLQSEHKIVILDKHQFLDGSWIGAGVVSGAKNPKQTLGFRMVEQDGNNAVWADLSYDNALILAGCLIKACHQYDELKTSGVKLDEPEAKKAD